MREAGWELVNADCVLVGEEPRIGDVRDEMCADGSPARSASTPDSVAVRATTTDRLGFTGRGEGLAAQAVALLAAMKLVRYADRPDLLERRSTSSRADVPRVHEPNEPGNLYWGRLYTDFPDFQVALVDGDELLAEAHAVPLPWDGTLEDLPSGWDEGFVRGMTSDGRTPRSWRSRSASRRAHRGASCRAG